MKKIIVIAMCFLLAGASAAFALPFSSWGTVDPNFENSWDAATASGIARYYFYFDNPSVSVNMLQLRFEGDVFNLGQLDASDFSVINPGGWNTILNAESSAVEWSISSGTAIDTAQDPIILQVQYSLLNADRMFAFEGTDWAWDEGQAWGQSYTLSGPLFWNSQLRNWDMPMSGGSTSPVPEPGSIALLGMGILGLFGLRKKA